MKVNVLAFGQISDITGDESLEISGVTDTDQLVRLLHQKYDNLKSFEYRLAVNKKMISGNTELKNEDTVALLPPFSGG